MHAMRRVAAAEMVRVVWCSAAEQGMASWWLDTKPQILVSEATTEKSDEFFWVTFRIHGRGDVSRLRFYEMAIEITVI